MSDLIDLDVDIDVAPLELTIDPQQCRSFHRLKDYYSMWRNQNIAYRWHISRRLRHGVSVPAKTRWHYALRLVQHHISPTFEWRLSSFYTWKYQGLIKDEYLSELMLDRRLTLCEKGKKNHKKRSRSKYPDVEQRLQELQVLLPMQDVLTLNHRVMQMSLNSLTYELDFLDEENQAVENDLQALQDAIETDIKTAETDARTTEDVHRTRSKKRGRTHAFAFAPTKVEEEDEDKSIELQVEQGEKQERLRTHQVNFHLDSISVILVSSLAPRRPLLIAEMHTIILTKRAMAPLAVRLHMSPGNWAPPPESHLMEFSVSDVRALCPAAPSAMSSARRLIHCCRSHKHNSEHPKYPRPVFQARVMQHTETNEKDVGKSSSRTLSQLFIVASALPLEILVCKPLLQKIGDYFRPPAVLVPMDSFDFRLQKVREHFLKHRLHRWRERHRFDQFVGNCSQLLKGKFQTEGVSAKIFEAWTGHTWLCEHCQMPPGIFEVARGGVAPASQAFVFRFAPPDDKMNCEEMPQIDKGPGGAALEETPRHSARSQRSDRPSARSDREYKNMLGDLSADAESKSKNEQSSLYDNASLNDMTPLLGPAPGQKNICCVGSPRVWQCTGVTVCSTFRFMENVIAGCVEKPPVANPVLGLPVARSEAEATITPAMSKLNVPALKAQADHGNGMSNHSARSTPRSFPGEVLVETGLLPEAIGLPAPSQLFSLAVELESQDAINMSMVFEESSCSGEL
eukprot:gnl/MRDRNA2_/MRDRNA2_145548_c0_seq1.p1 gnl/MRDRNA2_/MRDRNA2_145548_c0~~gnl/MRDRNA2_/MRDRNA2_145548_c0_seq1.p1  ORF type:complete len:757 (-),score=118.30 gnl/MRDRNA2_/MRDRNA2_145548_c0_seq1:38-2254(-)